MDERHWWFAAKLQETFHFGGYDNPTLLEDFLSESDVGDLINRFLSPGEPCKLFFYCNAAPPQALTPPDALARLETSPSSLARTLHVTSRLTKDVVAQGCVCLYVLRKNMESEIESSMMEKELFCGEIRQSLISSLAMLLTEAYLPILQSQVDWGQCSEESITSFLQNLSKFSSVLSGVATEVQMKRPVLRQPSRALMDELSHGYSGGGASIGSGGGLGGRGPDAVLKEVDVIIADWSSTIESMMIEIMDERLEDPHGNLVAEQRKWQRKYTMVVSLSDQLKSKECRKIISTLFTLKSRLTKKWKAIDIQVTEALNSTKDHLHYFEIFSPYLESLESRSPPTPGQIASTVLPSFTIAMRQKEGMSRVFARSGFLGGLLTKLSNTVIRICVSNLESFCYVDRRDQFWSIMSEAVEFKVRNDNTESTKKSKGNMLLEKLQSYLELCEAFKSFVSQARSAYFTSNAANLAAPSLCLTKRMSVPSNKRGSSSVLKLANASSLSSSTPSETLSYTSDSVISGIVDFTSLISKVLEIIDTLTHYTKLLEEKSLRGLPRFAGLWNLHLPFQVSERGDENDASLNQSFNQSDAKGSYLVPESTRTGVGSVSSSSLATTECFDMLGKENPYYPEQEVGGPKLSMQLPFPPPGQMSVLKEESWVYSRTDSRENQSIGTNQQTEDAMASTATYDSTIASLASQQSSRAVCWTAFESQMNSVGLMVQCSLDKIKKQLEYDCKNGVVDVFAVGRNKSKADIFALTYQNYTDTVVKLDNNISSYLKALFSGRLATVRALDIISCFSVVSSHGSVRKALDNCMLAAFTRYGLELEEFQHIYERDKSCPYTSRGAPPVTSAIQWARHLLSKVQRPMEVFRKSSVVMQSMESMEICRIHNKLATVLLRYETLWLNRWKASIEVGQSVLKAPLLVQEAGSENFVVKVNCIQKLLELFSECKGLLRLGIPVPEAVYVTLTQETRVKKFKQQLDHLILEFHSTRDSIDPCIRPLMAPHINSVIRTLLPGWTTLTWNTMNIDAFLHKSQTSVEALGDVAVRVNAILNTDVYSSMNSMKAMTLFDSTLATSRTWNVQEFTEIMLSSIIERSNKLIGFISVIHQGLMKTLSLTHTQPRKRQAHSQQILPPLHSPGRVPSQMTSDSNISNKQSLHTSTNVSSKSTPQASSRDFSKHSSMKHSQSVGTVVMAGTPVPQDSMGGLEPGVESAMMYFCETTLDITQKMVLKSHEEYSRCLQNTLSGAMSSNDLGEVGGLEVGSSGRVNRVVRFDVPDTPDRVESLVEVLKHDKEAMKDKMDSLIATFSESSLHLEHQLLKLIVDAKYSFPKIILCPSLIDVEAQLMDVSSSLLGVLKKTKWWLGPGVGKSVYELLEINGVIESRQATITQTIQEISPSVTNCLKSLHFYDSIWMEDLHAAYKAFLKESPDQEYSMTHVRGIMEMEQQIDAIPDAFVVGPLQLSTKPAKNSLKALAVSWKIEFHAFMHEKTKHELDQIVGEHEKMLSDLQEPIDDSLQKLREVLLLLQNISDLQHTVDEKFLPVEQQYALLREIDQYLPRVEVRKVDGLRAQWDTLTKKAEAVKHVLLVEKRQDYESEVDKQVKSFGVETIRFRNSFDSEGPLVPGLHPSVAVERLGSFLDQCEELKMKRTLLDSVQRLLNIPLRPYPELDQTERDLSYLRSLYDNYQQFIAFDSKFRQELWSEVDLNSAQEEVQRFWKAYSILPVEQQEWEASRNLEKEIRQYLDIFPLLKQLHSKEIRNRHWLQVMTVVNCTFQLEGTVFRMAHLLDSNLLLYVPAIQEIINCAKFELQLEEKLYSIEEEWSEQALVFQKYRGYGSVLLALDHTYLLMERLEHDQVELSVMLMSRYIQPLKEEAIQWAAKLSSLADILQQWIFVQTLWNNLEAVFNTPGTASEFQEEAIKFASTHKRWLKLMKKASETKNILTCCSPGEDTHSASLAGIRLELEHCKKSLKTYLQSKREAFPRFFYVSDDTLLSILSNTKSISSIRPHLVSVLGSVTNLLTSSGFNEENEIVAVESIDGERLELAKRVPLIRGVEQWCKDLLSSIHHTLHELMTSSVVHGSLSLEEVAHSQVSQVALMTLYFIWSKECESALMQCRYDRRALPGARNKFISGTVNRLVALLSRNAWKSTDEILTCQKRASVESLVAFSMWLRDMLEDLCRRKLKDIEDFEWQRFLKPELKSLSQAIPNSASPVVKEGRRLMRKNTSLDMFALEEVKTVVLTCLRKEIEYGFEFLSYMESLPLFETRSNNYIICFTQSSHTGSLLIGPVGTGKKELVKTIGQVCGRNVVSLHCLPHMCGSSVLRVMEGLIRGGRWGCFSNVDNLHSSTLSVLSQMMQIIMSALELKTSVCTLPSSEEVPLKPGVSIFLTSCYTPPAVPWTPPASLAPMVHTFSFPMPDPSTIVRSCSTALGIKGPKAITNKLITLQNMAKEQLSNKCPQAAFGISTICNVLKVSSQTWLCTRGNLISGSSNSKPSPEHATGIGVPEGPLLKRKSKHNLSSLTTTSTSAVREHGVIAQVALNIIGASLPAQELAIFSGMIHEVFCGSLEAETINIQHSICPQTSVPGFWVKLKSVAEQSGLHPSQAWMCKIEQLSGMVQLKHAVILVGQPATGKSSALNALISILNTELKNEVTVKLSKVYPNALDDLSELFGCVSPETGDWEDGVFTSIFKKAHQATQSVTWLCLDGFIDPSWVQYIAELLDKNKVLTLSNGEHLVMNESAFKLILETESLEQASPAALQDTGIVYFGSEVLGWRPVVKSWLKKKSSIRESETLLKYFEQIMDPIVDYIVNKVGKQKLYSEIALLESCLSLLATLLKTYNETAEVFSEVHIERLLLFSVVWSYGGSLIGTKEQMNFSFLLKTLTNSLPDDDSQLSVFDYYVDESGEWDVWQSRLPLDPELHVDMLGSVFVNTVDTNRVEILLELALASRRHTLIVGPHGSGKTTIFKHFLQGRALSPSGGSELFKQIVVNGHSKSDTIMDFMRVNFHHRQGYTYGPKQGKLLECFIDDLHLPLRQPPGSSSLCSSHEYLRQLADLSGIYGLQRKNEYAIIEDLILFACVTGSSEANISPRLRRHMNIIHLPEPTEANQRVIVSQQLSGLLKAHCHEVGPAKFDGLLEASLELYSNVREILRASDMPGRLHYFFSIKQLVTVFQGICQCITEGYSDSLHLCWIFEVKRAFTDGLCRVSDKEWMHKIIEKIAFTKIHGMDAEQTEKTLNSGVIPQQLLLSAFSPEIKQGNAILPSCSFSLNTLPQVNLWCLEDWSELRPSVSQHMRRYKEESDGSYSLDLSDNNLCYLVQLHRSFTFSRGNAILVGALGQELRSLTLMALFLAGYEVQSLDLSSEGSFREGMKALLRQAALGGRPVGVILEEKDLKERKILQELNSIVSCGESVNLFTNDELEGLIQALVPSIRRDFPTEDTDPLQYFIAKVFRNIRFIFCLTPNSPLLGPQAHDYKGILEGCTIIWTCDWRSEALLNSASYFFAGNPHVEEIEESLRTPLMNCLLAIHSFSMQQTGQLIQAGLYPDKASKSRKDHQNASYQFTSSPNHSQAIKPTTFQILVEKLIQLNSSHRESHGLEIPYVGPKTLIRFLECFCEIFHTKFSELESEKDKLTKALSTLHSTHEQVVQMKSTLKELKHQHEDVSKSVETLLQSLIAKSCQLEKLKAVMGESSSVYSAMQMVSELERKLMEGDDDDELLALCLDKRASRLESLLQKAQDRVKVAKDEDVEAKQLMNKAKEVALHWQSKIDRNTIDEVKRINSPPHLVGTIMELMLTLLNQYGTAAGEQSSSSAEDSSSSGTPGHMATFMSKKKKIGPSAASTAKMEKEQWNTILLAMGDSQKFLDMLNSLKWEDGLSTDASNLILSRLAVPGRNVPQSESDSSIDKSDDRSKSKDSLISISMARYAAEAAGFMCAFAVAIVEYTDTFKPYKIAAEKLSRAQQELQEIEASLQSESNSSGKLQEASLLLHKSMAPPVLEDVMEESEGDQESLAVLQGELDELQEKYDEVVKEKYSLAQVCQQLTERLKAANFLLDSLKERQASWQQKLDGMPAVKALAAKCIIAATVTVYCGSLKTSNRHLFFQKLRTVCKLQGFGISSEHALNLEDYPLFMLGKASLLHLIMEGLPQDPTSLQNAAILAYSYSKTWPLILDSLGMAEEWMKKNRKEDEILTAKYQSGGMGQVLMKAMEKGMTLLISSICTAELSGDSYLQDVLQCRRQLLYANHPVKVMIGDTEIDCSPKFKLVLFSSDDISSVPADIASMVNIVSFHPEIYGIQQSILDSFLHLHNEKISQNRDSLRNEMYSQTVKLEAAEKVLLELLMNQENFSMEELHVNKNILSLNKTFEDALESRTKAELCYSTINSVHLSHLQGLASQAGVIMSTVWVMGAILPAYSVSYSTMLSVFLNYIEQMGSRIVGEDTSMKMTRAVYHHFVKGYFEKDKYLFSFVLSGEIEINQGKATREEKEFLISPSMGQKYTVRGLTAHSGSVMETAGGPVLQFGRKPFDWMSDSQWQMLLLLASRFAWIHPILDKLGKDGKDAVWRTIGEGVAPEIIKLNETLGHKLLPMQQLLILSAMRPERVSQCIESFVCTVLELGPKQRKIGSVADVSRVARNLKPTDIPIILFRDDPLMAITKLKQYAAKIEIPLDVCYLHGTGQDEINSAVSAVEEASKEGYWILLHNVQTCPELLATLPALLNRLPARLKWKVWVSIHGDSTSVPVSLIYMANKVVLDPPLSLYSSVVYCLNNIPSDILAASSRVEWLPALHCMAMLHATLCLRRHVYSYSLLQEFQWSFSNFLAVAKYMVNDFAALEGTANASKPVSWSGMRYMIAEVIYGSAIIDPTSLNVLSALVDHWIHTGGPKREVGRYHIPQQFFIPTTKLNALVQAVETANPPLVLTAELCGLYFSPIIKLGWTDYQFSRTAYLYSFLEENKSQRAADDPAGLEQKGSVTGDSLSSISSAAKGQLGPSMTLPKAHHALVVIEKLPSFISMPSNLADVHLSHLPASVLETITTNPALLRRLPLQQNVEKLLDKFPSIWKKELINERLKKHGADSPFGIFIKSEISHMIKCCQFIQDSLKGILVAISPSTSGDTLLESSHLVYVTLSLLNSTVPQPWQEAVGPTSPPISWPLKDWLQDLFLRYTFLDRVMYGGLAKTATYWLGGFFNPAGFLNIMQQAIIRSTCERNGTAEQLVFHAELTNRDKDHIRDPPPDGEMFVYGAYVWACAYERSTNGDFQEIPPKQVPVPLPVLHLTASILKSNVYEPPSQTATFTTEQKGPYAYHCPCFFSNAVRHAMALKDSDKGRGSGPHQARNRELNQDILFTVTMTNSEMNPAKWSTRNVACTLRPF